MGVGPDEFYDEARVAIIPMGFCFPGLDATGGDLPPRKECARTWHARLFAHLPRLELLLLIGGHAQSWHLGTRVEASLTKTVASWENYLDDALRPTIIVLPHPSWRNNGWIKRNPWFAGNLLPRLKAEVRARL